MPGLSKLLASMLGLLIGAMIGAAGVYAIFKVYYEQVSQRPGVEFLAIAIIGGGFALLGGWIGGNVAARMERTKRAKHRRNQPVHKFVPRKKRR